jgi:hypothetical protein
MYRLLAASYGFRLRIHNGSNPHAFSAGLRALTELRCVYGMTKLGDNILSVGSSITRDLRYIATIHMLSPLLWSSDSQRTDVIARHFRPV